MFASTSIKEEIKTTKEESLELLETAPQDEYKPSRVNPGLPQAVVVKIVQKGIEEFADETKLSRLFEKRVWQAVKNQIRPRF